MSFRIFFHNKRPHAPINNAPTAAPTAIPAVAPAEIPESEGESAPESAPELAEDEGPDVEELEDSLASVSDTLTLKFRDITMGSSARGDSALYISNQNMRSLPLYVFFQKWLSELKSIVQEVVLSVVFSARGVLCERKIICRGADRRAYVQ